jgi:hypothetical protein
VSDFELKRSLRTRAKPLSREPANYPTCRLRVRVDRRPPALRRGYMPWCAIGIPRRSRETLHVSMVDFRVPGIPRSSHLRCTSPRPRSAVALQLLDDASIPHRPERHS